MRAHEIDDVDLHVGMLSAHVGPDVGRVLGPVRTIRAIESRQLAAGVLQMMLKIVAPVEGPAALGADVLAMSLPGISHATVCPVPAVHLIR